MNAEILSIRLTTIPDDDPDLSWLEPDSGNYDGCAPEDIAKYLAQDSERLASYGESWEMIGIRAVASVRFATGNGSTAGPEVAPDCVVSSGGLWGIESDSGSDYFDEVGANELTELSDMLASLGFASDAIAMAIANVERGWS